MPELSVARPTPLRTGAITLIDQLTAPGSIGLREPAENQVSKQHPRVENQLNLSPELGHQAVLNLLSAEAPTCWHMNRRTATFSSRSIGSIVYLNHSATVSLYGLLRADRRRSSMLLFSGRSPKGWCISSSRFVVHPHGPCRPPKKSRR
jgi:hypothetical protein